MGQTQTLEQRAKALVEGFLDGSQDDTCLDELEGILEQLPAGSCPYERGVLAFAQERTDEAIEHLCTAALEESGRMEAPPECDELVHRWEAPFDVGDQPEFWSRLAGAFGQRWAESAAHLLLLGYAALERDDDEVAVEHLIECLDLDGSYWAAASHLGAIYQGRENWKKARTYHELALVHARGQDKAHEYLNLGRCYLALGQHDAALRCYQEAVETTPTAWQKAYGFDTSREPSGGWKTACAYYLLGDGQLSLEDTDGAIDSFAYALNADEGFWLAAADLGDICSDDKNWRGARAYYEQALAHLAEIPGELPGDRADIYFALGWCCHKIKDHEAAVSAYRGCLEEDADYRYARGNLGWALLGASRAEEAVGVFRESVRRGKDGKYAIRGLARALRKLGRYAEAIEVLRQDTYRGRLTKSAAKRIEELEALIDRRVEGEETGEGAAGAEDGADLSEDDGGEDVIGPGEPGQPSTPTRGPRPRKPKGPGDGGETPPRISREADLEALLERRILRGQEVFGRRLRMFQADDSRYQRYGRQFAIPDIGGRIDLLTMDMDTDDLVVIELKRDRPERETVAQVWEYVSWVHEHLATEGQEVKGIICVWEATERLLLATRHLPGVEVFHYDVTFTKKC